MQAVILAAGNSNRFYPYSSIGHKSQVSLFGKPLIVHTLLSLKKAGIRDVVIVVSKESEIPFLVKEVEGSNFSIRCIVQEEKLGMGHALLQAKPFLGQQFFLLSGYHLEFGEFYHDMLSLATTTSDVVLLAKQDVHLEAYGVLQTDRQKVTGINEKVTTHKNGMRVIGMYLLCKEFLEVLGQTPLEHYHFEKALDAYAKRGNVYFTQAKKPTFTLKYAWDLLEAKEYLLGTMQPYISKNATIAPNVLLQGNIYISDGVKILEGVSIKGPCFLGENVVVGNNAILRNGVVAEKDVVIGATMEIKNSLLMTGVTTHTGFIGDSVIGPYSRLAAGFCSANVRFDRGNVFSLVKGEQVNLHRTHVGVILGDHVDSGTNVSTMPGIIVGNHVTIGPSTTLMQNVEDNSLVYTKFETVVKKQK